MGFVVYCHVSVVKGESGKILMAGAWCIYGFMGGKRRLVFLFIFFFLFSFYGKQDGGEAKILFSAWECFMQRPEAFSFLFSFHDVVILVGVSALSLGKCG